MNICRNARLLRDREGMVGIKENVSGTLRNKL